MVLPMRVWNPIGLWPVFSLVLLLLLGGCDEDERAEPYQVEELRVLAIRAEPPESTDSTPVTFDALVVEGSGDLTYAWRLCPFAGPAELGYPCLADEIPEKDIELIPEDLRPCILGETASTPSFEATPCSFDTYEFILEAAAKEQGFPLDLSPETGLEMSVRLQVTDETGRTVDAIKGFAVTGSESPNSNPVLSGVVVQEEPELEPESGDVWEEDEILVIDLEEAPILQVTYDPASAELVSSEESVEAVPEELLFSWYATSGVFERGRTAPDLMDNEFRPDGDMASADDRIWVVVRDGRGGIGWIERRFSVTGAN